jgi:hypothetical protein
MTAGLASLDSTHLLQRFLGGAPDALDLEGIPG